MIEQIVKENDVIILGNFNNYSHEIIQNKIVDLDCRIIGGWNFQEQEEAVSTNDFLFADSVVDMKNKLTGQKPNTALIFIKSAILDAINNSMIQEVTEEILTDIRDLGKIETIDKIIFLSFNIDILTVRSIYKEIHNTKMTPYFITGFHAAYLGANPEVIMWNQLEIDPDLDEELRSENITSGKFLDVGTGSGRQAIWLHKRGFNVTGIDLVPYAFSSAQINEPGIRFQEDNILHTKLEDTYDYIFDRGCYHSIDPSERNLYFEQINKLLNKDGLLFMKCRSTDISTDTEGYHNAMPYCISKDMYIPEEHFQVKKVRPAEYLSSSNKSLFNALFFVIKKI
ncbi:class I SAM-dependent methyltransferase [Lacrimispora algidixylanolytica]|uniref:Methyltransferase domain-containing protein n=1 Tax=Lacrimispora algidixylanolytica TaxID=94868 RepID=A0A419SYF3_9FIRM|nr:class I SAM-dependent methyltransferase [Lacrimispora algidixylanolytica]RKD30236.1 hypothetical protein BET01_06480 [Lacrimispora algidixylanolytica]